MRDTDRKWLEQKFSEVHSKLDRHERGLTCLETKWNMTSRFGLIIAGLISFIISIAVSILWR